MASSPDASPAPSPTRYYASDFYRLTNRRTTSPLTPDFDSTEHVSSAFRNRRSVAATDRRANAPGHASPCTVQGSAPNSRQYRQGSGSSVKEDGTGVAQSFLESINTALPVRSTSPDDKSDVATPDSGSCTCCCHCGRSPSWRISGPRGHRRSKSYTAMRTGISELSGIDWKPHQPSRAAEVPKAFGPSESPLEKLPVEILEPVLDNIIGQLALDIPPAGYGPRNVDLVACLLTSRTIHVATINTLYSHITLPHSSIFSKFLKHISEYPGLGTIAKRLDLSHFTSVGLGRSRQVNSELQNMTSRSLLKCLELTPEIQEVLLQENLDDDVDENVLRKLFFGLKKLRAVDFCASSSKPFVESFSTSLTDLIDRPSFNLSICRLGLHECFTLPSSTFEILLPRLPRLTHLDVSHTRITDDALSAILNTASLTHLNLGRCTSISGRGVVDFLTSHPAARQLQYLNLSCDIARYRLLWETDIERLLPALPTTLRSLNLNGAKIRHWHTPLLIPLTKHLEELSLASAELSLQDINSFFCPGSPPSSPLVEGSRAERDKEVWMPPSLHYLDLSSIPSITQSALFGTSCMLLSPETAPLEVIELGDKAISSLRECRNTNKRLGWVVKELGRRGWYVRDSKDVTNSNGKRSWKMGAMWWGMRKCPVAWGEVGGLYGHYMFKK
ncbi:MAG: hypothetical protein LQ351_001873 [Letrouitia transgressa]|nr:MAG: hypothetical protein LQ351_001873 [Letrouitia transgressa]